MTAFKRKEDFYSLTWEEIGALKRDAMTLVDYLEQLTPSLTIHKKQIVDHYSFLVNKIRVDERCLQSASRQEEAELLIRQLQGKSKMVLAMLKALACPFEEDFFKPFLTAL